MGSGMDTSENIDRLCDRFEAGLALPSPIEIEDLLPLVAEGDRPQLLSCLIQIELEYCFSRSSVPAKAEYFARFPGYENVVSEAFYITQKRSQEPRRSFEASLETSPDAHLAQCRYAIEITEPRRAPRVVGLKENESIVLGRSAEAEVRLYSDKSTSRRHCRIDIHEDQYRVTDLGSRNGTRVNGVPVQAAVLAVGDRLSLGAVQVTVLSPGETALTSREAAKAAPSPQLDPATESHSAIADMHVPGYRLLEVVGKGGVGVVYAALYLSTGEKRAIKLLSRQTSCDAKTEQRFVREAALGIRLSHRRIVRCHDFGATSSGMFIVLDYVEKVDTVAILRRLDVRKRIIASCALLCQALSGVRHAHEQHVVHRDLKPENLLVARVGKSLGLWVSDFGLAKNYLDAGFGDLTKTDEVFGTVAYMAPEQILNCRFASPAADIYSLGTCLYRFLTGRVPFEGPSVTMQMAAILNDPPTRIEQYEPALPAELCDIVHVAIDRSPSRRFSTANEMQSRLRGFVRAFRRSV